MRFACGSKITFRCSPAQSFRWSLPAVSVTAKRFGCRLDVRHAMSMSQFQPPKGFCLSALKSNTTLAAKEADRAALAILEDSMVRFPLQPLLYILGMDGVSQR